MAVEMNITNWIETENGLAHMDRICSIFYAKIMDDSDSDSDDDDGEDAAANPTHGVWASFVSGDSALIFKGTEGQAQAIIEGLRTENSATNLRILIPESLYNDGNDDADDA